VGFRPFVHQLANRHGLGGFVGNEPWGVLLEIEGTAPALERFQQELGASPPPLCSIEQIERHELTPLGETVFSIVPSQTRGSGTSSVPPDVGTCEDCLRELNDPRDRRFRYPFINCSHCGPRYTVIRSLPYDRPFTTLSRFSLCPLCASEYDRPGDRRFHAQPIACPACGPQVWLETEGLVQAKGDDAITQAIALIDQGWIVAIKGIGGFHLACDATNPQAVARLRQRKHRESKPFAIMVKGLDQARHLAAISDDQARFLCGPQKPIVLLKRSSTVGDRSGGSESYPQIAREVAPGTPNLGIMLPYSPLHHLLVGDKPLVMTSGNLSDEPIARDNQEARSRLSHIADAFLMHDRDIQVACDDSVIQVVGSVDYPLRRSRGYAPLPVHLPHPVPPVLAVGGELKATLCVTMESRAILSQHLGDVTSPETLETLERSASHLLQLFQAKPRAIACDLHPDYLSSQWATQFARKLGVPLIKVPHHEAHAASLLLDYGWRKGRVLVACFDGTGYGPDGTIWGGEFFLAKDDEFQRVDFLHPVPLPGGQAAIRRPYRMALATLWAHGLPWTEDLPCVAICPKTERRILLGQLEGKIHCPSTTSAGRWFDAIASLVGIRHTIDYEAQAAIEMEALAEQLDQSYPTEPRWCLQAIIEDLRRQVPVGVIAGRFHNTVADRILETALRFRPLDAIGLTGGVFQNALLLSRARTLLQNQGFTVLLHHQVPTNDGGLALGQAWLACQRLGQVVPPHG